jgi:hypothetical protein
MNKWKTWRIIEASSMIRLNRSKEMNNKYEAAEVVLVGNAQDTILGIKDQPIMDNRVDIDMIHRDSPIWVFDE